MNEAERLRYERNVVSNMYPGHRWHDKVAVMPTDQVTAIYLRAVRDGQKPIEDVPVKKPDPQGKLF